MLSPTQLQQNATAMGYAPKGGTGSSVASSTVPATSDWVDSLVKQTQSSNLSTPSSSTGVNLNGSFSPTSTSTGNKIIQDTKDIGSSINSRIQGTGDNAGKSTLNRATGIVSDASSVPIKAAMDVLPQGAQDAVGKVAGAAGGVINYLGDKIGNIKGLQDWSQAHPEAAKALEDIAGTAVNTGNIAGNVLAVGGAAEGAKVAAPKAVSGVEGVVSKATDLTKGATRGISNLAEKVNPLGEKSASLKDATKIVSPKMTARDTASALAEGRGQGGGMLSKTKIAPDPMTTKVAEATQNIVKKGVPASKNIANIRQALSTEAENLKSQIESVDHPYSFKELNAKLNNVETPISIKGTAFEKQIDAVKQAAMKIAKDNGGTVSSLLDARKGFDSLVSKEYPNLYESASAPMKNAITSIRNAMNDFIEQNLPDNLSFKDSLDKQSLYYRAIDNIAEKSVGETKTTGIGRVGKTIKNHPVSSLVGAGVADKILKNTTGFGI